MLLRQSVPYLRIIHTFILSVYVFNPTVVMQEFFRACDKKVCIKHHTENGTTFSVFLQEYLGFLRHIKPIRTNVWIIRRFGALWRKSIVTSRYQLLRLFETPFSEAFLRNIFTITYILNAYQNNSTLLKNMLHM